MSSRFESTNQCAVLTPPGVGAIAVIRVTGADAWPFVRDHLQCKTRPPTEPDINRLYFGAFLDGDETADDVVVRTVAVRSDGASIADVCCHGGWAVVARLLDVLREAGFAVVPAEALEQIEFDCDPIEHEVLRLTPSATTRRAALALLRQREILPMALRRIIERTRTDGLEAGRAELEQLLDQSRAARFLTQPARIAVIGPVNAGKSSLVNALAGRDSSITHHTPGATLDYVTADATLEGIHVQLIDTPGGGGPADELAQAAARTAAAQIVGADLRVVVVDVEGLTAVDSSKWGVWANHGPYVLAVNKIDRIPGPAEDCRPAGGFVPISAQSGAGLDRLSRRILRELGLGYSTLSGESLEETPLAVGRLSRELAATARQSSSEKFAASLRRMMG